MREVAINCRAPMTLAYLLGLSMLKRKRGGPTIIPGWTFRLANIIMQRILSRKSTIKLMGRVTRGMYQQPS